MWSCSLLCLCLCLSIHTAVSADPPEFKLPSYITVCYRDDPKVAECLRKNIQKLVPVFKSGSKDFKLRGLDPQIYKDLTMKYTSPIAGGKLLIPWATVSGMSSLNVMDVRPKVKNPHKFVLDFDNHFPFIKARANFNLTGNIVRIPVNIDGRAEMEFEDVNITFHLAGDVETIGEYDYLNLKVFNWQLKGEGIRNARIVNKDLIDGKPALNELTRNVINASWRQLKTNILPSVLKATDTYLRDLFSEFFKQYPYDILFPRRTRAVETTT